MSTITTPTKDPSATDYFSVDVSAELDAGETITSLSPVVTGANLVSSTVTGNILTAWISGGTLGAPFSIKFVAATSKTPRTIAPTLRGMIELVLVPTV